VAVEPRHASWFTDEVDAILREHLVARVIADPPRAEGASEPGGFRELTYVRLHGSPRVYFSSYSTNRLHDIAALLNRCKGPRWCIFDNTASGAATANALGLLDRIGRA
jgi:uncharacterized protein YecE (DUF72 family)